MVDDGAQFGYYVDFQNYYVALANPENDPAR
jgi:hypothetical protein